MAIKQELQNFYDHEAKKYYETRKKIWHDVQWVLAEIKNHKSQRKTYGKNTKEINILELGCGGGRFCDYLEEHISQPFNYTGVDLSQELLDFAKKDHPKRKFIRDDMSNFVQKEKQENYDFIILTAAFQHIPTKQERLALMKHFYRILNYEGTLIMLNRSFSDWFKKKYATEIRQALWKYILSFGKHAWNDILIPRKNKEEIFHRYYHLFQLKELEDLTKISGFSLQRLCYLDKKGQCIDTKELSNNSLLIAKKQAIWG